MPCARRAAAIVTIALKVAAWRLTGSVGLLSDALDITFDCIVVFDALYFSFDLAPDLPSPKRVRRRIGTC